MKLRELLRQLDGYNFKKTFHVDWDNVIIKWLRRRKLDATIKKARTK